ncbi:MAG: lysostaphin resistance A-like protein [Akkermansiaceae bacterium]
MSQHGLKHHGYYWSRPWVVFLAVLLAIVWIADSYVSYQEAGVVPPGDDPAYYYDERGVIEGLHVSMLIAEQGESVTLLERLVVGAETPDQVRQRAIRYLEHARARSMLGKDGLLTLACVYWDAGEAAKARSCLEDNVFYAGFSGDADTLDLLLNGEKLRDATVDALEYRVKNDSRDWVACFLLEKTLADLTAAKAERLKAIVNERRQGLLIANAKMSIVTWLLVLAGLVCLWKLLRCGQMLVPAQGVAVSRLPSLWPLAVVIIAFTAGEFLADEVHEFLWNCVGESYSEMDYWIYSLSIDALWRILGVIVLVTVFYRRPSYAYRSLMKPVPKLMHWVLAALAVTWLIDEVFYLIPAGWFPRDTTIGLQWEDYGWGGLVLGLVSGVILAPICEEIVFRGFLYNAIKNRLGTHAGVWLSAIVFGAIHFYGVQDLIAVGMFGVVMGYLYHLTGSLWPCILCHALFNLIITVWDWTLYSSPYEFWSIS